MAHINHTLMNVGGDEYKRDGCGNWFIKEHVTFKWVKCNNEDARFLSWCASEFPHWSDIQ